MHDTFHATLVLQQAFELLRLRRVLAFVDGLQKQTTLACWSVKFQLSTLIKFQRSTSARSLHSWAGIKERKRETELQTITIPGDGL